jgi:hypothetical protein
MTDRSIFCQSNFGTRRVLAVDCPPPPWACSPICHCTDCQSFSGSAFRTIVRVTDGTFRLLSGEPTVYVKTAESGAKRAQGFCPRCGSPIYATAAGEGPKTYSVRLGTVRQRNQFVPKAQIWTRSRQPWVGDLASVRSVETQ